jgi:secreted PhoX family phosphatase
MNRRTFLRRSALLGGAFIGLGPFHGLAARAARGQPPSAAAGYGPLVPKGELALPAEFNYQVISRQGQPHRDGTLTAGTFDGMGAFPGPTGTGHTTILIRNHENRERAGEIPVVVPEPYDPTVIAGNSKLVVRRQKVRSTPSGIDLYEYEVVESFNILGGTSTNCAGGVVPFKKWITCEEIVKGPTFGVPLPTPQRHGYIFEIDALSEVAVPALPVLNAGRFVHEATTWRAGVLYQTEDRNLQADAVLGVIGSCFYRYIPDQRVGQGGNFAETTGVLQALKLKGEFHANMDTGRVVGVPYEVEWVTVDDPDHDDDTDNDRTRTPGRTPTRIQAQDKGAAFFDRLEGMWAGTGDAKIYFDATEGGALELGQVWEYDPGRETLTLVYESSEAARLENPDNVVIVPQTGDIFLCEDGPAPQFIRGVTQDGEIYDFCAGLVNRTEFAGACFDPDGQTLYVNQYGQRGGLPEGPASPLDPAIAEGGVTYAIYGPFEKRIGNNSRNFGNGPSPE